MFFTGRVAQIRTGTARINMLEGLAIPCDTITPLLDMAVSLGFEPRRRSSRLDAFEAPAIDQLCQLTMVGAERIELSSDDYKSSALTFVLRTYGLQRRTRTFNLSCRRRPLYPFELFGEEGDRSHPTRNVPWVKCVSLVQPAGLEPAIACSQSMRVANYPMAGRGALT